MCIAIVKPAEETIDRETLEICYENNDDGCGFAYINTDNMGVKRLKIKKSMDFEDFYQKYERALELAPDSPFLIHFRIKTHGTIDTSNCHPFKIDKNHAFIHNGVISNVRNDKQKSDTRIFNEDILRQLPKGWADNKAVASLIEEFIGYSKVAVLTLDKGFRIFNEKKGNWVDGVWFSNTSYKRKPVYTHANPTYGSTRSGTAWGYPLGTGVGGTSITGPTSKSKYVLNANRKSKRIRVFTSDTFIPCDYCGIYHKVEDMIAMFEYGSVVCFCPKCDEKEEIWYGLDLEAMLSLQCHLDWLAEEQEDVDIEIHDMKEEWVNPWGYEGGSFIDDYNDAEEVAEETYALGTAW